LVEVAFRALTAKAGVNRTAFYLHYTDKNNLLDQIRKACLFSLKGIVFKPTVLFRADWRSGFTVKYRKAETFSPCITDIHTEAGKERHG